MRRFDFASLLDAIPLNVVLRVIFTSLLVVLAMSIWSMVARSAGTGVNKAFNPATVTFGTDSALTITLLSSDPTAPVSVTSLTDNLPAGIKKARATSFG